MSTFPSLNAIIVSQDQTILEALPETLKSMGINSTIHTPATVLSAIGKQKSDAFFVDRDIDPELSVLARMRSSLSNQRAVAFAIVPREAAADGSFRLADFILEKPVLVSKIKQTLRAAYGFMIAERRRYFRCQLSGPATVVKSTNDKIAAELKNISQTGIAFHTSAPVAAGDVVQICFSLPGSPEPVTPSCRIIWSDAQSRAGAAFATMTPEHRTIISRWIVHQFDSMAASAVAV
ncbi:MAG TPA: PilZ domain-containing protein [Terriglobales bacterium]|nr:PilZ domain-containing protein [Terriglobales bacterium]